MTNKKLLEKLQEDMEMRGGVKIDFGHESVKML